MYRKYLALGDHHFDVEAVLHRTDAAGAHRRAHRFKHLHRIFERARMFRSRRDVFFPVVAQHPDTQSAHRLAECAAEIDSWIADAAVISGVVTGNGLQQDRAVLGTARHRSAVIESEGIGNHARPAHQPVSRHQPGDAAERRRPADRTAGIGTHCCRHETRSQCCAGAAR